MAETRMLNRALDMAKYQEVPGGLLVNDVPLLAAGIWTDSAVGTPLHYGPEVLKACAANWKGTGLWTRHAGGEPRSIIDLIGDVRDPRFDPAFRGEGQTEPGAIVGDLFYDYSTRAGRDAAQQAISRAKAGNPLAVSVEHSGGEQYASEFGCNDATSLTFFGLASVERGACMSCKMPRRDAEELAVPEGYAMLKPWARPRKVKVLGPHVEIEEEGLEVAEGYKVGKRRRTA